MVAPAVVSAICTVTGPVKLPPGGMITGVATAVAAPVMLKAELVAGSSCRTRFPAPSFSDTCRNFALALLVLSWAQTAKPSRNGLVNEGAEPLLLAMYWFQVAP